MQIKEKTFNMFFALGIVLALGTIMYFALREYLGMLFGSIIIFTLFKPLQKWLVLKKKFPRILATLVTLITSVITLVVPVVLTLLVVGNAVSSLLVNNSKSIGEFITNAPSLVQSNNELYTKEWIPGVTLQKAFENVNINYGAIIGWTTSFVQGLITQLTTGISSFFLQLIVMYFILYFIFKEWDSFARTFYKYSPFNTKNTSKLIKEFSNITFANIVGSGAVAITQGFAIWLGFVIFGVPGALFWGFVTAVTSFLPLIGAPLVWIPAVLIFVLQGNWFGAIGLLIWSMTIVSWIDNFARPIVTSRVGNIHPLISIVGIFIGLPMFGFWGIILGPALLSFFLICTEMFYEEFLDTKKV